MDDTFIRRIVRDEMARAANSNQFQVQSLPYHVHNGSDAPRIPQNNIIPGPAISGSITMSSVTTYTLNLNGTFTPSLVTAYGNVVGSGSEKYITYGTANLSTSFYFQPLSNTSVLTGNIQYPFVDPNLQVTVPMQNAVYFGTDGTTHHTLVGTGGHIVDVAYPAATIHARATVTEFSKNYVLIDVTDLDLGWSLNINWVIT